MPKNMALNANAVLINPSLSAIISNRLPKKVGGPLFAFATLRKSTGILK